jgi:hypothetical protein
MGIGCGGGEPQWSWATAMADMYGGGPTTVDLLSTGSHPHDAGVTAAVAQVL